MSKKRINKKKLYDKRKKKIKSISFLKEYSSVIMIGITIFAFIPNLIIWYHQKINSTNFYMSYISAYIDGEDWVKKYISDNKDNYMYKNLISPTINNQINKLLYTESNKLKGYYVTYFIIEQVGDTPAEDIKLKLKQYGKVKNLTTKELKDIPISNNNKIIYKKVSYPFPKNEKIKIPISICKANILYQKKFSCYYMKYKPLSIEFRNKYMVNKKTIQARPYIENEVIIDGSEIGGRGGIK